RPKGTRNHPPLSRAGHASVPFQPNGEYGRAEPDPTARAKDEGAAEPGGPPKTLTKENAGHRLHHVDLWPIHRAGHQTPQSEGARGRAYRALASASTSQVARARIEARRRP